MSRLEIAEIRRTSLRAPSQWEGRLTDGRPIYIRYRAGFLSVNIGPEDGSIDDALDATYWFARQIDNEGHGYIELDEVCRLTGLIAPASR